MLNILKKLNARNLRINIFETWKNGLFSQIKHNIILIYARLVLDFPIKIIRVIVNGYLTISKSISLLMLIFKSKMQFSFPNTILN